MSEETQNIIKIPNKRSNGIPLEYIQSMYKGMPEMTGNEIDQNNLIWSSDSIESSKYPIFILSKGRWNQSIYYSFL